MGGKRITGNSFDTEILGEFIHVEKGTVSISDNSQAVSTRGIPDGWVAGDVSATVELEISTKYIKQVIDAARKAGSFRELPVDDVSFYANTGAEELNIEAFGVKFNVEDLLDFESKGSDVLTHKLKGAVTSSDFIHIDGVPYLSKDDTRNMVA